MAKSPEDKAAARIAKRIAKLDAEYPPSEPTSAPVSDVKPEPIAAQPGKPQVRVQRQPEGPREFFDVLAELDELYTPWRELEDEFGSMATVLKVEGQDGVAPEYLAELHDRALDMKVRELELFSAAEGSAFTAPGSPDGKAAAIAMKRARLKRLRPMLEAGLFGPLLKRRQETPA